MSNQLKFIFRSMTRHKVFSGINIVGLAVGIAAVMLIYRIVHFEMAFNKRFANYERIVRIVRHDSGPNGEGWTTCVPGPAGPAIQLSVPQLEAFSRATEIWPSLAVPNPNGGAPLKKFNMEGDELAMFVDPAFVEIFEPEWLAGDPLTALSDVGTIVLTQKMAEKCFGNWESAMNQHLVMDNQVQMTVRGVMADFPANTDFPVLALVSYSTLLANKDAFLAFNNDAWGQCASNFQAYGLLKDPSQFDDANAVLATLGQKEYAADNPQSKEKHAHQLQKLSELHFNESLSNPAYRTASKDNLKLISFIGLLVLAMACFNFVNLSTAKASQRAKEIGVRKTLGVSRGQLIRQFLLETGVTTLVAVVLGVVLAAISLPLLRNISDVPPSTPFLTEPSTFAMLAVLAVAITLLAGAYPSLVLAGFSPAGALKSHSAGAPKGQGIARGHSLVREGLVVLQFTIAAGLIVGTLVSLGQMDFIKHKDMGYEKGLVYTFSLNPDSTSLSKLETLRNKLHQLNSVEAVSFSSDSPTSANLSTTNFAFPAGGEDAPFGLPIKLADANYQKTYGLRMVAGRWFEPSDTIKECVVNEYLLKKLGIADMGAAIGQNIRLGGPKPIKVVGVVADFHTHSIHQPLEPLMIAPFKRAFYMAGVKIKPDNLAATTASIQRVFDEVYPEQVFAGQFFDESVASFYENENRFSNTCKGFGLLAVFIACLGLFGLSMHTAARRTKEIGVRKVLGASVTGLTGLLAKDFLKLVIVSLAIAFPLAYWLMDKWLADFAFRIEISFGVFLMAGFAALLVAFAAVGFQSIKAALANPVESLKNE
jgi:putative ABC transport system permease protein